MILFPIFSLGVSLIKKIYLKHLRQCFITFPNNSKFVKNTLLYMHHVFSSLACVGIILTCVLCLTYYIPYSKNVKVYCNPLVLKIG